MQKTFPTHFHAFLLAGSLAAMTIGLAGCTHSAGEDQPTPEPTDFDKTGGALNAPGLAPQNVASGTAVPSGTTTPGPPQPVPTVVINPAATPTATAIPTPPRP